MHALIIEDEPLIAMSIEEALRDCGYTSFAFAVSVEQAVDEARVQCPDLITADVQLSPGCGIDAVAAVCGGASLPVIFVTGTAGELEVRRPGSIIVHKPFKHSNIRDAVSRAVAPPARSPTAIPLSDIEYYRQRAEAERSFAAASPTDEVAALHEELAVQYEALVSEPGLRSDFRIKWSAPTFEDQPRQHPTSAIGCVVGACR